jgi:hypothetical protein
MQGSRQNRVRAMNKLFSLGFLAVLVLVGVCLYWYTNPHNMPEFLRGNVPGVKLPSPRSPMSNFQPPQF